MRNRRVRAMRGAFAWAVMVATVLFGSQNHARAQTNVVKAQIAVASLSPAKLRIDLKLPGETSELSFRNVYGSALGLAGRIEGAEAVTTRGKQIPVNRLAPGQFRTSEPFERFSYFVKLEQPERPGHFSQVSWLNREHGLLILADLLPAFTNNTDFLVHLEFDLPNGWKVASSVGTQNKQLYVTGNPEQGVFLVGPTLDQKSRRFGSTTISIFRVGRWPFPISEAFKRSEQLIEEYSGITGFPLKNEVTLMLMPFPGDVGSEHWSAETRGSNVALVMGNQASRKRVLARLGIVLSHELFHLWVPNSLGLSGDYDWFFEGFTQYQALRTALRLGWISFETYLETIARVHESYMASVDRDKLSLLEASERRWTSSSSLVYDKGLLVAFAYDLSIRTRTHCQASSEDIYHELFRSNSPRHANGNEIIIKLLSGRAGMESFGRAYVQSAHRLEFDPLLSQYGLQLQHHSSEVSLRPMRDLSQTQRKLLACLGYRK